MSSESQPHGMASAGRAQHFLSGNESECPRVPRVSAASLTRVADTHHTHVCVPATPPGLGPSSEKYGAAVWKKPWTPNACGGSSGRWAN